MIHSRTSTSTIGVLHVFHILLLSRHRSRIGVFSRNVAAVFGCGVVVGAIAEQFA